MKRENYQQLELFSGENQAAQQQMPNPLLNFIRTWEKTILLIIGLVITGIASFSLGVEKGKKAIQLKTNSHLDIALKGPKKQPIKNEELQPVTKDELNEYPENYTIQVASFVNRKNAQKEADILKKKGLVSIVVSKGKFSIVCVGNFSKRQEAQVLLPSLKKQYRDCLIRRL